MYNKLKTLQFAFQVSKLGNLNPQKQKFHHPLFLQYILVPVLKMCISQTEHQFVVRFSLISDRLLDICIVAYDPG